MRKYGFMFTCLISVVAYMFIACTGKNSKMGNITSTPRELQQKSIELIQQFTEKAINQNGQLADSSLVLNQPRLTKLLYEKASFAPLWFIKEEWLPAGDSLFNFIKSSQLCGLFPEDYHLTQLINIRQKFFADSFKKGDRNDAALWSQADILMTDGFLQIVKDVKLGRLPQDSITLRKDSVLSDEFYQHQFEALQQAGLATMIQSLEPRHWGYQLLKAGIRRFLDSADNKQFSIVPYPEKNSAKFNLAITRRLYEEGFIASDSTKADSSKLADAIKKIPKEKRISY